MTEETKETTTEATSTSEHVETAKNEVTAAIPTAPTSEVENALKAIKDALGEVKDEVAKLVGVSTKPAEKTTEAANSGATPAEVETVIETPAKTTYYVVRNGRKVKRER